MMGINCNLNETVKGYILAFIMVSAELNGSGLRFNIDYPREDENGLVEGRVLLLLSQNDEKEPRFQISDNSTTGFVFGVDAIGKQPAEVFKNFCEEPGGIGGRSMARNMSSRSRGARSSMCSRGRSF